MLLSFRNRFVIHGIPTKPFGNDERNAIFTRTANFKYF